MTMLQIRSLLSDKSVAVVTIVAALAASVLMRYAAYGGPVGGSGMSPSFHVRECAHSGLAPCSPGEITSGRQLDDDTIILFDEDLGFYRVVPER